MLAGVESNNGLFFPLKQSDGNLKTLEEQVLEEDVNVTQVLQQLNGWKTMLTETIKSVQIR